MREGNRSKFRDLDRRTFVVVVRREGEAQGAPGRIYRGEQLSRVLKAIARDAGLVPRARWPDGALNLIRTHYNVRPAAEIAEELSRLMSRRITKNMVISRAHAIGAAKKRPPGMAKTGPKPKSKLLMLPSPEAMPCAN